MFQMLIESKIISSRWYRSMILHTIREIGLFCRAPGSEFTWVRKILVNSCWLCSFLETILGTYEKSSQFGVWNQGALADLDSLLFPYKVIWRASNWSRPPRNFQNRKFSQSLINSHNIWGTFGFPLVYFFMQLKITQTCLHLWLQIGLM